MAQPPRLGTKFLENVTGGREFWLLDEGRLSNAEGALAKGRLSDASDPWAAVADLYGQSGGPPTAFALIFCSPRPDLTELAVAIRQRFGELPVSGSTTTGEIKPFGSLSGVGSPAGDLVVAAPPWIITSLRRFNR